MRKISHFAVCNQNNSEKIHYSTVKNFKLEAQSISSWKQKWLSPRTVMTVFGHAARRQVMSQRMVSLKLTVLILRPDLSSGRIIWVLAHAVAVVDILVAHAYLEYAGHDDFREAVANQISSAPVFYATGQLTGQRQVFLFPLEK